MLRYNTQYGHACDSMTKYNGYVWCELDVWEWDVQKKKWKINFWIWHNARYKTFVFFNCCSGGQWDEIVVDINESIFNFNIFLISTWLILLLLYLFVLKLYKENSFTINKIYFYIILLH